MPVFSRNDDRLHSENYKLRTQLEKIQSEGYLGSLIAKHAEEISKKDRKISVAESRITKLCQQHSEDLKMIRILEFDLGMAGVEVEDFKAQLKQKDAEIAQCHLAIKAQQDNQEMAIRSALADRDGVIQKMKAQINRDYTNSSIPSSQCMGHETIHNGRTKTGRKPGGQPGHPGHHRKVQIAQTRVNLEPPCSCLNCEGKKILPTGRSRSRQLVDLKVVVSTTDFISEQYHCEECGASFYADFPDGLSNEVNYGPEIKSFATFLNNYCNVSLDKTAETLWEMSDGAVTISKGALSNLSRDFSRRTSSCLTEVVKDLRQGPVIHTDATNARVSGKNAFIFVYANKNGKVYSAQVHKGIAALTDSPIDGYSGILVHDHDTSFYRFGENHQECNVHILRYLLDAAENEPDLTWHRKMRELLLEMNRNRKVLLAEGKVSFEPEDLAALRLKYEEILDEADQEYTLHPPTRYYRNGVNLCRRLRKYMENHLLFLSDFLVPFDNNLSERSLRTAKGKVKNAGTFRSMTEGMQRYCDFLSIAETSKCKNIRVYRTVRNVFCGEKDIWKSW